MAQAPSSRRSDADRNRQAIIAAFTDLLASDGADVPLYRVARRAGVGQATLYRHFPERRLLAMAVYEERMHHLAKLAALHPDDPRAFWQLIQELVLEETRTPGLLRVLRAAAEGERYFRGLRQRSLELLAEPLEAAKTAGTVHADVQLDDVQIIFAMLDGAVREADTAGRPQLALRALDLLFRGVSAERSYVSASDARPR